MGVQKQLVHDYANFEGTTEDFFSWGTRYGLIPQHAPRFTLRGRGSELLFLSQEGIDEYVRGEESGNPFIRQKRQAEPRRLIHSGDMPEIEEHIRKIRDFLERAAKGEMIMGDISAFFKRAVEIGALTSAPLKSTPYRHGIVPTDALITGKISIQDKVDILGILLPVHDINSPLVFEYTKKCAECGDFYQAKGEKAIYCSEKCRSRARARTKKTASEKE